MEKYLYFRSEVDEDNQGGVGAVSGGGSTLLVPASKLTGMLPTSNTNLRLTFESVKNAAPYGDQGQTTSDIVDLTIANHKHKEVMDAILNKINGGTHTDGFIVIADDVVTFVDGTTRASGEYIHGSISACTVSLIAPNIAGKGTILGISGGTTKANSYGVGVIDENGDVPIYKRRTTAGIIITTVKFNLIGLKVKGDAANDVIGLAAGGAAYIYKNVPAENGLIFKQTLTCLETTNAGSGTVTDDINITWNSSATLAFDGAAGTGSQINAGDTAFGDHIEMNGPHISINHYAYITEGDSNANNGVFDEGVYLLTMYGHVI